MESNPLISVAMPVFNCEKTVAEAVQSILNQTYTDCELIIIDDGSTDHTLEVLSCFEDDRIRVIKGEGNQGLPARLNEAVALSKGAFFARMDGDDVSYPNRLRHQLDYLLSHPEIDLLGGAITIFDRSGEAIGLRTPAPDHAEIVRRPWGFFGMPHVTWMGLTSWFQANPYRPDALHAQDRELLLRTRKKARFAGMPDVLVGVRENSVTLKKTLPARKQFIAAMFREGIAQRSTTLLTQGIATEFAKGMLDAVAVWSGLKYQLLRHRVPHCPQAVKDEWARVRDQVKADCAKAVKSTKHVTV